MRTTIDKAGRVVIPAAIRDRAGLVAGSELEITEDERGIRLERVAQGPRLVKVGRRLVARPTIARNALVFVLFALGLMTKPAIVTLPCLLLLLDFWPLRRWPRAAGICSLRENSALLAGSRGGVLIRRASGRR